MNIYSAKFMNEASADLADKVFKRPIKETYLYSTLNMLNEMNNVINENTKKLYIQISEAESKEDENKLFADYFYKFKTTFQEFANKVQEMKSRMIISIENKVETWEDLIKDDQYIACFDKSFNYTGWNFSHMEESDYPRLNLYKLYQKEFDYLGQLMQDTGMGASPSAKLKIIASVSNNFNTCSGDKSWIKKLVQEMIDVDEKEVARSYSECIYNALRDKYDFTVDKGMLYTCKESLCDYEDIIDAASKLCDDLLSDLDRVAENISSYLFRNSDKKLKIKTDTDGIIDRDYRLDTYSMNQLDLFLKNKINQIRKVLNVYCAAIGIKFDTAVDYIDQNIKILQIAKDMNCENEVDTDKPALDDTVTDDVPDTSDDTEGDVASTDDMEDNDAIDTVADADDVPDTSDDNEGLEPEDTEKEVVNEEEPETDDDEIIDYQGEEFEEAYLFEADLFELQQMQDMYSMCQAVKEALLLEEESNLPANQASNVEKLADKNKNSVWQRIVSKLAELWKRFKEIIQTNAKRKVEYLNANGKFIEMALTNVQGTVDLEYNPDIAKLERLEIPDLNYQAMQDKLGSEEAFCSAYWNDYYEKKGEGTFSDAIKREILGDKQTIDPTKREHITEAFNFCKGYIQKTDYLKKQQDTFERAQRAAKTLENIQESSIDAGFNMYFYEMDDNTTEPGGSNNNASATTGDNKPATVANNNQNTKSTNSNKANQLTVYFKVCSQVLAAQMTIYQKIFNEYFKFCHWYIVKVGGPSFSIVKKENEPNKQNA